MPTNSADGLGLDFSTFGEDDHSFTANMDQFVQFRTKFNKGGVEEKFGQLITYRTALESEGSLSLNIAMEADMVLGAEGKLVKTYFDGSIPKNKKYEIAMEALGGEMYALIGAAIGVLIAVVAAIVMLFKGKSSSGGGGGGGGGASIRITIDPKTINKIDESLRAQTREAERFQPQIEKVMGPVEEVKSTSVKTTTPPPQMKVQPLNFDGVEDDIIGYGPWSQYVEEAVQVMLNIDAGRSFQFLLKSTDDWYHHWIQEADKLDEMSSEDRVKQMHDFKTKAEESLTEEVGKIKERLTSFKGLHSKVHEAYHKAAQNKIENREHHYGKLLEDVKRNIDRTNIRKFVMASQNLEDDFEKIEKALKQIQERFNHPHQIAQDKAEGRNARKVVSALYRQWFMELHVALMGTGGTISEIGHYLHWADTLVTRLARAGASILSAAGANTDGHTAEALKDASSHLKMLGH